VRKSVRMLLLLASAVLGGCVHTWVGTVPAVCPPSSEALTLPPKIVKDGRLAPGTLFIQLIADEKAGSKSFAFLIYSTSMKGLPSGYELKDGDAYLTHIIGPMVSDDEWRAFYNSLSAFASTRPGGFYCDKAEGGCAKNKVGQVLDGDGERLAWGPLPPAPPPPESFGVIQNTQAVDPGTLGGWASAAPERKNALYASLSYLPAAPASCRQLEETDARRKELGEYVIRALRTRQASYGDHPYPYGSSGDPQ
jgi:hypothetical protein